MSIIQTVANSSAHSEHETDFVCPRHGAYRPNYAIASYERWVCGSCRSDAFAKVRQWTQEWATYHRWKRTEVPQNLRNRRLGNYRPFTRDKQDALMAARSLVSGKILAVTYLGNVGTGKSHLASGIVAEAVRAGRTGLWISVPELTSRIKASFSGTGETEHSILSRLDDASLLVLDEIDQSGPGGWHMKVLSAVIDRRYRNKMPIVLTGNVRFLSDSIGVSSEDRIREMGVVINLAGESYRQRAPNDAELLKPDDFAKPSEYIEWIENIRGSDHRRREYR